MGSEASDALFQAALAQHRAGQLNEAAAGYRQVVALAPEHYAAHLNLGVVLRALRRLDEALASYDRALAIRPRSVDAHHNRGAVLFDLRRAGDALASYDRAIALGSDNPDTHHRRGLALRELGRLDEALASLDHAIGLKPDEASLHRDRGGVLLTLKRWDDALASYERALALGPESAGAHNGRGTALVGLGRLEAALASYGAAIARAPDFALAHRNRGVTLRKLGRPAEAVQSYDAAIALNPDVAEAYWYRSLCHLATGRFAEGWRDYERRWDTQEFVAEAYGNVTPQILARLDRAVERADLAGRDVLLVGEQGVGDVLMFASLIPDVVAAGARVSVLCDRRLRGLFAQSFPGVALLDPPTAARDLDRFDRVLAIGSLGRLFRNRLEDFPGAPYLAPRPEVRARWAERLGPAAGRKRVGLSWRGGLARTGRSDRSLDLEALRPVLDLPDCEFVSLQYGAPEAEVAAINAGLARPIRLFPADEIDDFEDLAGLVQNLDLVISVQTALVHLCGALGAPALVMVPATAEWRYMSAGPSMPWYDSITLFRQGADKDWGPVVRRVTAAAETALQTAG